VFVGYDQDNDDVMFDWTAEITGTGDRSKHKLEIVLESCF